MTPDPAVRVSEAFREVTLGLMSWADPPVMGHLEYRSREALDAAPYTYRPYDPQGEVEPFDVQADWDELA